MILITGGAGFIGSHIVDKYISCGYKVIVIDNLSTGVLSNVNKAAIFYKLDLCSGNIESVFKEHKIEVINHHAAQIDLRKSLSNPLYDARINIEGSIKLFQLAVKYGVKKIIYASSGGAVYGEQKFFPADENHITNPLSPYGISKFTVEKYLYYYKYVYGIDYVILRYSNVYGPRQSIKGEAGVVSIFCRKLIANDQPVINGSGRNTRDFIFVSDVADANIKALMFKNSGIFNISTSKETSVNNLLSLLKKISKKNISAIHKEPIKGEQRRSCLDYSLAQRKLKWKPLIGLKEGLETTYRWFLENK
ncbi:MAG: NAD-dependent epimerase/dehydratase family protein [Ignavibacteria bacterium]|nr:NAD-dependent epimerase/dehydratase family protein [Ignavibacteria bacterium]